MNGKFLSVQVRGRALLVKSLVIAAFLTSSYATSPRQQGPSPSLIIEAPSQVELGDRIELQLSIDHAQDIGGYEAQLLFDTSAAHFSGLQQRDSDLKKFGRDVIPLEEVELPDGIAMGLASCPYPDCVEMQGTPQPRGANGRVRLGTVLIGTDQEGLLELSFENLKFVDSNGNAIPVDVPQTRIIVQVGQENGASFPAPAGSWQWSSAPGAAGNFDITGEGLVNYEDAIEGAFEWKLGREQGQPCGPVNDRSRDVNGDGCIDVADIQTILANTTGARPRSQSTGPAGPAETQTPVETQTAEPVSTIEPPITAEAQGTEPVNPTDAQIPAESQTVEPIIMEPQVTGEAQSAEPANPVDQQVTADAQVEALVALTFTVNSKADSADSNPGDGICASSSGCTLRAAITEANRHSGADMIRFNIPGTGVQTIQLNSRLPSLSDSSGGTTIDGYSQPGSQANTNSLASNARIMIELRGKGPNAFDLMQITSAGNVIRGIATFNARRSLWLYGSGARNNVIAGNFIGTSAAGTFKLTTHYLYAYGVELENGASNNRIGGTSVADRNVISGNARTGLDFNSEATDNNVVYNNLIGLNPPGNGRLQNLRHGIDINSGPSYNTIGGTASGQRNILSGNGEDQMAVFIAGIEISHSTLTSYNKVIGNCIGTDPTCNSGPSWALNRHYGIKLEDGANNNTIANNVIGNNPQGGIRITGSGSNRNQIRDNRVGISLNNTAIPNGIFGIQFARSTKFNGIGPNNIITNSPVGVQLLDSGTDGHTITRNSIYNNSRLGIDLGSGGVTSNDSGDGDTGANEVLNWPVLSKATATQVSGKACAETVVPKPCVIEIFVVQRTTSDSGGGNYGQGKTFVGSATTSSSGSFTVTISGVNAGQYLTATATDAKGNTSEFSRNIQVSSGG